MNDSKGGNHAYENRARVRSGATAISALILSGFAIGLAPAAVADVAPSQDVSDEIVSSATEFWDDYGVSEAVQRSLVEKIRGGALPDDMRGAAPVAVERQANGAVTETVATYPDGSISVTTATEPVDSIGGVTARGVNDCQTSTIGPGVFRNDHCRIDGVFSAVRLGFFADTTTAAIEGGSIDAYHSESVSCIYPLECTPPEFQMIRDQQEGSAGESATLYLSTVYSGVGTGTTRLALYVDGLDMYTN